jgi:hypothetical protein
MVAVDVRNTYLLTDSDQNTSKLGFILVSKCSVRLLLTLLIFVFFPVL